MKRLLFPLVIAGLVTSLLGVMFFTPVARADEHKVTWEVLVKEGLLGDDGADFFSGEKHHNATGENNSKKFKWLLWQKDNSTQDPNNPSKDKAQEWYVVRRMEDSIQKPTAGVEGDKIRITVPSCHRETFKVPWKFNKNGGKARLEKGDEMEHTNDGQGDCAQPSVTIDKRAGDQNTNIEYGYAADNNQLCRFDVKITVSNDLKKLSLNDFRRNNSPRDQNGQDLCPPNPVPGLIDNIDIADDSKQSEEEAQKSSQQYLNGIRPAHKDKQDKSNCSITNIGWLVCPVLRWVGGIIDGIFGSIAGMLSTPSRYFDDTSGVRNAWENMRNVANIGFAILFIIMIISHLTSIGISNYSIKKLLPRIIVAAITINISFYLCALASDFSNILGVSLKNMLGGLNITTDGVAYKENSFLEAIIFVLSSGTVGVIAGVAGGAGAAIGAVVGITIPLVIGALLISSVVYIILVARQAILVLLIILSPVALMCMFLPNTRKIYEAWRGIFIDLLLLFPAISLLFGSGELASAVFLNMTGPESIAYNIAGVFMRVMPLAGVIYILWVGRRTLSRMTGLPSARFRFLSNPMQRTRNNFIMNRVRPIRERSLSNYRSARRAQAFESKLTDEGKLKYRFSGALGVVTGASRLRQKEIKEIRNARLDNILQRQATRRMTNAIADDVEGSKRNITSDGRITGKLQRATSGMTKDLSRRAQDTYARQQWKLLQEELKEDKMEYQDHLSEITNQQGADGAGSITQELKDNIADKDMTAYEKSMRTGVVLESLKRLPQKRGYDIASAAFKNIHNDLKDRDKYTAEEATAIANALGSAVEDSAMKDSYSVLAAARNVPVADVIKEKSIRDMTNSPDFVNMIQELNEEDMATLQRINNSTYFQDRAPDNNKRALQNHIKKLSRNSGKK